MSRRTAEAPLAGVPKQLGRYRILGLLGCGGMGRILRAHDPTLRREVAIKLIETAGIEAHKLEEVRYLFHREARATAQLQHPNIIQVLDYSGADAEHLYIACELLAAPTLDERLAARGALAVEVVAALAYELAGALVHAHARGILHRDIKPENIFWQPDGRVVLADFGIAKSLDGSGLGATVAFGQTALYGSPVYMAPEVINGQPASDASDIYALGATLYEAATGAQLICADTIAEILQAALAGDHTPLRSVVRAAPQLCALIEKMVAVDVAERPHSAAQLVDDLRRILDDLGVTDPRRMLLHRDRAEDATAQVAIDDRLDEPATSIIETLQAQRAPGPATPWLSASRLLLLLTALVALGLLLTLVRQFKEASPAASAQLQAPGAVPNDVLSLVPTSDVAVALHLEGVTEVWVDGRHIGTWSADVRIMLPAGRHQLEGRRNAARKTQTILLLANTEPDIDLRLLSGPQ